MSPTDTFRCPHCDRPNGAEDAARGKCWNCQAKFPDWLSGTTHCKACKRWAPDCRCSAEERVWG